MKREEGPWDQVSQIIGFAHTLIHQQGIVRIQTDIRITTRYALFCSRNKGVLMF